MKKIIELFIQKNPTEAKYKDRKSLLNLSRHKQLAANTNIVYIYTLIENKIGYPLKEGNILYIGEAGRGKEATGERFKHIHSNLLEANNYCGNYTLTVYYNRNEKIKLTIYLVKSEDERKSIEQILIKKHLKEYGAVPIAQGSSGKKNTPKNINNILKQKKGIENIEL